MKEILPDSEGRQQGRPPRKGGGFENWVFFGAIAFLALMAFGIRAASQLFSEALGGFSGILPTNILIAIDISEYAWMAFGISAAYLAALKFVSHPRRWKLFQVLLVCLFWSTLLLFCQASFESFLDQIRG